MDKYIGRLLDNRYEILEVIGTGGMAVVYKARCHRLNRLVAIKILKDDYLEDEDFRRRFHAESQAVAMLSHPNIVAVYDVSTSIMADYIVMELIEGITLKQYMEKKGVLNWKETLHFAIQIAKALEHAHSRGIVHRDIKPHNVMVLTNGSVKVADFGIARMMSKGNTLTKEALGSVHYISPEQARGGRVDNRSDLYSLGVVMYEMMTGRPPYDGDSPVSVAIQHINGGAVMPSTLNPNIPGGMEQIIMKAMAHDPADRYVSATQMLGDMDAFRKDPTMLFDYNIPPLDAVIKMQSPVLEFQPQTTAQRVAQKETGGRPTASKRVRKSEEPEKRNQEGRRRARQEQEDQNRSRVATIAIIACSLVAMVAVVVFLVMLLNGGVFNRRETLISVPDLLTQVYDELPEYDGLKIEKEETYDDVYEAGVIIYQNPKPGEQVVRDTKIKIKVSLGKPPRVVKMNNLQEMSLNQAIDFLDSLEMNLSIEQYLEFSDTISEGHVTRTEPDKGTQLSAGQTIKLWVSKGVEIKTSVMPDVVTQTEEYARDILDKQKLGVIVTSEEIFDSVIPAGRIVKTEPAKGGELKTGQPVKLYISKGPQTALVPNVLGMDVQKAVEIIISAGFNTPKIEYVASDKVKDIVLFQSEEPNSRLDVTKLIALEISKGPEAPTEPETVTKTVTIPLPDGHLPDASYMIDIKLKGVIVQTITTEPGAQEQQVQLTGSGKQVYELWIGNRMYAKREVDFTVND